MFALGVKSALNKSISNDVSSNQVHYAKEFITIGANIPLTVNIVLIERSNVDSKEL
jgi:hypothetical protein